MGLAVHTDYESETGSTEATIVELVMTFESTPEIVLER